LIASRKTLTRPPIFTINHQQTGWSPEGDLMPKNPLEMTNTEWQEELARLSRMHAARRQWAFDQADTQRALAKIDAGGQRRTEARSAMIQKMVAKGMSESDAAIIADAALARR
jgi:hypothetical protein